MSRDKSIKDYEIALRWVTYEGSSYYIAYLPAFGALACSATGDTVAEALESLDEVFADVSYHYMESGRGMPRQEPLPFLGG